MWQEEVGAAVAAAFARWQRTPDGGRRLGPAPSLDQLDPIDPRDPLGADGPPVFRAQRPTAPAQMADFTSAAPLLLAQRLGRPDLAEVLARALAQEVRGDDGVADAWARGAHLEVRVTADALAGVVTDLLDGAAAPAVVAVTGTRHAPVHTGDPAAPASETSPARETSLPVDPARAGPARLVHARTRNVSRAAADHGVRLWPAGPQRRAAIAGLVEEPGTRELMLCLASARDAVDRARAGGRPAPVLAHLDRTATAWRDWFERTRVTPRGDGAITSAHRSRLCLNDATTPVLAGGLAVLGLDAPEHL